MRRARGLFEKFHSSDGRIKVGTLSGVSVVVAAIALLVGVLPAIANHTETDSKVAPKFVQYGGGSGACEFVQSDATKELHINNPTSGPFTSPDGTEVQLTVTGNTFAFEVLTADIGVFDVVVNGGPHNNHYDYDGDLDQLVREDQALHAPLKNATTAHNLSHVNICYDAPTVTFVCGGPTESAFRFEDGEFTVVTGSIFANSENDCVDKSAVFFIDNTNTTSEDPNVKLDFGADGGTVVGRLDVTKVFGDDDGDFNPDFEPLEYSKDDLTTPVVLDWCILRDKDTDPAGGVDGDQFNDELPSDKYPSADEAQPLGDGNVACKVAEFEDATGKQLTVVYFEFKDPRFY